MCWQPKAIDMELWKHHRVRVLSPQDENCLYYKTQSLKRVTQPDLQYRHKDICMMHRHMSIKSTHMVHFQICGYMNCPSTHCRKVRVEITRLSMFLRFKQAHFAPTRCQIHPARFRTYLELKNGNEKI